MATTQAPPIAANIQQPRLADEHSGDKPKGQALIPVQPALDNRESVAFRPNIARFPVELDVAIPVHEFRVHNLLALTPGQLVETKWSNGEDVPLASGDVQLAWSEFEVIETQLAVRITRLA